MRHCYDDNELPLYHNLHGDGAWFMNEDIRGINMANSMVKRITRHMSDMSTWPAGCGHTDIFQHPSPILCSHPFSIPFLFGTPLPGMSYVTNVLLAVVFVTVLSYSADSPLFRGPDLYTTGKPRPTPSDSASGQNLIFYLI